MMVPTYQAQFVRPLVDQLIAILQRDQQAALNIVNATRPSSRALIPFAAFYKETAGVQNWPAAVVAAPKTAFDPNADMALRSETVQLICTLAMIGADPEWLAEDAMDYVHAVDIVLTSAPMSDFYLQLPITLSTAPGGTTTGLSATSHIQDLRIVSHDLGELARRGGTLTRSAQIEFVVQMDEQ